MKNGTIKYSVELKRQLKGLTQEENLLPRSLVFGQKKIIALTDIAKFEDKKQYGLLLFWNFENEPTEELLSEDCSVVMLFPDIESVNFMRGKLNEVEEKLKEEGKE